MCGICGFNWSDQKLINDMAEVISHRGPDQMGSFVDTGVSLGHRRLSIIDLSEKGTQPMHNEDESISIVFNGEIYNFVDLRNELEQNGHIFQSNTDTEVIVHAYEQWGTGCVTRLRGMFAFAIWDSNKKQFFLAREQYAEINTYMVDDVLMKVDKMSMASSLEVRYRIWITILSS